MSIAVEQAGEDTLDYGAAYKTQKDVKVVKKDGSKESFNVQKVIKCCRQECIPRPYEVYGGGKAAYLSVCGG